MEAKNFTFKRYSAKQLTEIALKHGLKEPRVWQTKSDGWWIETENDEEFLCSKGDGAYDALINYINKIK